jgi:hypothetical protein
MMIRAGGVTSVMLSCYSNYWLYSPNLFSFGLVILGAFVLFGQKRRGM